jgi:hypothetical protein
VALALAVLVTQVLAHRPDPAAEPGLQIATVLLLETDAALAAPAVGSATAEDDVPPQYPDAGGRAARAAAVRETWAESARAARLEALRGAPVETREVRFTPSDWRVVCAWADRGEVDVVGRVERRTPGQDWRAEPPRRLQIELTRGDPVGVQRGWRLLSVRVAAADLGTD